MGKALLTIRRAQPDDAEAIVHGLRRAEGLTYFHAWMYDVAAVRHAIELGRITSWIALAPEDPAGATDATASLASVVAHGALEFVDRQASSVGPDLQQTIVEYGMVFTDPRYRGRGLAGQVGAEAMEWAIRHGVDEIWLWATTRRTYAQRAARKAGAQEMCLLLAMVPSGVNEGHHDDDSAASAAMLFRLRLTSPVETGRWFIPSHHLTAVAEIMADSPVELRAVEHASTPPHSQRAHLQADQAGAVYASAARSDAHQPHGFAVEYVESLRFAVVDVRRADPSPVAAIIRAVFALAARGADVTYLDLDPTHPDLMALVTDFERHGFTFAGIHPDYPTGRLRFRLQVLTCLLQPQDDISVVSERGASLLAQVWAGLPSIE